MDVHISKNDQQLHAKLSGEFLFDDNRKFREIVQEVESGRIKYVELDLGQLQRVDSAGLGMFIMLYRIAQTYKVGVSFNNMQGQVAKMFEISNLHQLFSQVGNRA